MCILSFMIYCTILFKRYNTQFCKTSQTYSFLIAFFREEARTSHPMRDWNDSRPTWIASPYLPCHSGTLHAGDPGYTTLHRPLILCPGGGWNMLMHC